MKLIVFLLLIIAGTLVWQYFQPQSIQQALPFGQTQTNSHTDMAKCITASGRIYYGDVPQGVSCRSTEAVENRLTVVPKGVHPDADNEQQPGNMRCDGRTHCSQMNSCEEAMFFLNNCPNTKMDGNYDGVPCERQWCG